MPGEWEETGWCEKGARKVDIEEMRGDEGVEGRKRGAPVQRAKEMDGGEGKKRGKRGEMEGRFGAGRVGVGELEEVGRAVRAE